MRDDQDDDQPVLVLNPIYNPIIANTVAVGPAQRASEWPDVRVAVRIGRKDFETAVQPPLQRRIGSFVKSLGGLCEENLIHLSSRLPLQRCDRSEASGPDFFFRFSEIFKEARDLEQLLGRFTRLSFLQIGQEVGSNTQAVLGKTLKPLLGLIQNLHGAHAIILHAVLP
jgi:hypothetical protein